VQGVALSYRPKPEGLFNDGGDSGRATVTWHSINLLNRFLPGLEKYIRHSRRVARDFAPDIIWAGSDAYHAIFGSWLAKRMWTRCVIDLYDDFESFAASRFPGVLPLFRRAVNPPTCRAFSRRGSACLPKLRADQADIRHRERHSQDLFYPRRPKNASTTIGTCARIIGTARLVTKAVGSKRC
jgi:hypothetical protein